jgi:hypothetical protein
MTFYEVALLTEAWRRQQAREDRRSALSAWVLAAVHRSEDQAEAYTFEEVVSWLGHNFHRSALPESVSQPATADELLERAKLLNAIYGGTTVNGKE